MRRAAKHHRVMCERVEAAKERRMMGDVSNQTRPLLPIRRGVSVEMT